MNTKRAIRKLKNEIIRRSPEGVLAHYMPEKIPDLEGNFRNWHCIYAPKNSDYWVGFPLKDNEVEGWHQFNLYDYMIANAK